MSSSAATFACAPMQAGLIYEALGGEAGLYVQQVVICCRESLDDDALRRAWRVLVHRHEALRTSFVIGESVAPSQRVHSHADLGVVSVDWRTLSPADRVSRWKELLTAERSAGFEPAHPPLMRVAICRLQEHEVRMLWTYHHAILDGRSRLVLLRELFELLFEPQPGMVKPWSAPPSFARFATWAAERGTDPATKTFWREALRGMVEPTPAPGTTVAPQAHQTADLGSPCFRRLDAHLSRTLRDMAVANALTPATVLQGAYALLLAQESDRDDVLYVTTRAGRRSAPFDALDTIGLLMVTSPVRLRVEPEHTVTQWLGQVRDFGRAVRAFEHAPLADVRRWSEITRPLPIAETLFSYENASMNALLRADDPAWERRDVQLIEQLDFPLTLEAFGDEEILVKVLHDPARVPTSEAIRILARYEAIVRACVERPHASVASAVALAPARRRELSGEAVASVDVGAAALVGARFSEQARRHPETTAVEHEDKRLSYAEVDGRADELTAHLAHLGAATNTLVAVAMARTPDMICTLLAVHRLGAAYLPLDPRYPADRIAFMLADSGAQIVVTDTRWRDSLPALGACRILVADAPAATAPESVFELSTTANDRSHVIYTSGSTGTPKGVTVEHGSVAQLTAWAEATFTGAQRDGVLASTSLSFDLSVFEILVTLALGGRVVLVDDVLALSDPAFRSEIAFVNSVPSALSSLTRDRELPSSVRTVALAGEALPPALVDRLYAHPHVEAVWNLYGPSEDTTYSTAHLCAAGERPLIGRPLPGTQAYVVDRHLQPVPEGVTGELLLSGQGLARGYLGREDLTSERFPAVDFEGRGPTRAYRTGDRVRWVDGGSLDYLGRLDDQVKIRGVRAEPGELEHALRELDGVADAAVVVRGDGAERHLVAYVVGSDHSALEHSTLRDALADRLPASLLPSATVAVETLPLTRNGKLDRRALPDPGAAPRVRAGITALFGTELALAELWTEVLDLQESAGPSDDFFSLGGDSLSALHLLAAVEDRFGRRLSVRALLQATTLAEQAATIDLARDEAASSQLIPLRPTGRRPPLVCVLTDQRGVMGLRNVLPAMLKDQPVFAMQAIDPATPSWRSSSVEHISAACLRAVRAEQPRGPYRLGGHSLGGLVAFDMACRLVRAGERVELLVLLDTVAPETFRWHGRVLARDRVLRRASLFRRLRGQANLVRSALLNRAALARGEVIMRSWPRGFDDPWDQAGAGRIMRCYRPPTLAAPVTVLHTRLSATQMAGPDLGWRRHVDGPVATRPLPGDHVTIFTEPNVQHLSRALAEALRAVDEAGERA